MSYWCPNCRVVFYSFQLDDGLCPSCGGYVMCLDLPSLDTGPFNSYTLMKALASGGAPEQEPGYLRSLICSKISAYLTVGNYLNANIVPIVPKGHDVQFKMADVDRTITAHILDKPLTNSLLSTNRRERFWLNVQQKTPVCGFQACINVNSVGDIEFGQDPSKALVPKPGRAAFDTSVKLTKSIFSFPFEKEIRIRCLNAQLAGEFLFFNPSKVPKLELGKLLEFKNPVTVDKDYIQQRMTLDFRADDIEVSVPILPKLVFDMEVQAQCTFLDFSLMKLKAEVNPTLKLKQVGPFKVPTWMVWKSEMTFGVKNKPGKGLTVKKLAPELPPPSSSSDADMHFLLMSGYGD